MRATYRCPYCREETDYLEKELKYSEEAPPRKSNYFVVHRIKDREGKIVWRNLFRMRIADIMFVISIIILLLGFWQVNHQCNIYLADPCAYAATTNKCMVLNISGGVIDGINSDLSTNSLPRD